MEYLRFADGLEKSRREAEESQRHQELLTTLAKVALVATDRYEEKVLFSEHFPAEETSGLLPPADDADVDFDYSQVDWAVPDEDELALLQQMLADPSITVAAAPDTEEPTELPPPREVPITDIEQDREWT